jgi:hypothetical protein
MIWLEEEKMREKGGREIFEGGEKGGGRWVWIFCGVKG